MQINGSQFATTFTPRSLELQDHVRKPVTIDLKASLELDVASTSPYSAIIKAPSQSPILVNEQQQVRFIRFFSASDLPSPLNNKDITLQASFAQLPYGVQQYLMVAATGLEFQKSLLDETV